MKSIFEIIPAEFNAAQTTLIGEISEEGFNYIFREDNNIIGIGAAFFEEKIKDDDVAISFPLFFHQRNYFAQPFKEIIIQFSFPQGALVPFELYCPEENEKVLNILFGDNCCKSEIFSDLLNHRNAYQIYRVCSSICDVFRNQFPGAVFTHQFTTMATRIVEYEYELNVVFYGKKLVVSLYAEDKFKLLTSFQYRAPQDTSWILLNATSGIERDKINVVVSGLVEESSILFAELKKYFNHIHFNEGSSQIKYNVGQMKHPAHYLSHIFAIEPCE
ncbi:MAG: DUF3822 family protein [Bacteroidetes bacterium]|nr:DUF3822 family protein [Bacteroidota bacterium]